MWFPEARCSACTFVPASDSGFTTPPLGSWEGAGAWLWLEM